MSISFHLSKGPILVCVPQILHYLVLALCSDFEAVAVLHSGSRGYKHSYLQIETRYASVHEYEHEQRYPIVLYIYIYIFQQFPLNI